MSKPTVQEIEDAWEQVAAKALDFYNRRMKAIEEAGYRNRHTVSTGRTEAKYALYEACATYNDLRKRVAEEEE